MPSPPGPGTVWAFRAVEKHRMCTLIALHRIVPGAGLLVAANRDEFHARRAEGPALRKMRDGVVLAPLDVEAGGTWLGVAAGGLFAAVTNVGGTPQDGRRRSRGLLVMDALASGSAKQAAERAEALEHGRYNPFNFFVADGESAHAITYDQAPRAVDVPDGVFVIGNAPLDAPAPPKMSDLRSRVEEALALEGEALLEGLAGLCRGHEEGPRGPLDAICVHTPGYGTRSSALLRLGPAGPGDSSSVFRFAAGAPCENEYEDFTPLLHALGRELPGEAGFLTSRRVS